MPTATRTPRVRRKPRKKRGKLYSHFLTSNFSRIDRRGTALSGQARPRRQRTGGTIRAPRRPRAGLGPAARGSTSEPRAVSAARPSARRIWPARWHGGSRAAAPAPCARPRRGLGRHAQPRGGPLGSHAGPRYLWWLPVRPGSLSRLAGAAMASSSSASTPMPPRRSRAAIVAVLVAVHRRTGGSTRNLPMMLVQVEPIWMAAIRAANAVEASVTAASRRPRQLARSSCH